ncbi:hypothetical protein [Nocardia otitidiscaviarum]|uniref:hypothetical protein n=1 Tax=Nocardia otitidiscaviarum TaxID=1823 RepID=UPI00245493F0|nr:hypothetical protein [Nocardia otitidiscaviarum]
MHRPFRHQQPRLHHRVDGAVRRRIVGGRHLGGLHTPAIRREPAARSSATT